MLKRAIRILIRLIALGLAISLAALFLPRLTTALYAHSRVFPVSNVPGKRVAIVFGAGLLRDGSPTPVLRDRVMTASELYFAGKVEKLLMSGDNRFEYYNEPGAMMEFALALGVPDEDIVLDYAGRRTYDTCYRAREIFGIQDAILVTQGFHLPRALYTCNRLGVSSVGVASDMRQYHRRIFWSFRELPATVVALWEVHVTRPAPVLGEPEPIFPYGS